MSLDLDVGNGIRLTYATPVLMRNVAGAERMNERLRKLILAREAADTRPRKGKHNSGVGGWRTGPDFLNWPDPEIAWLRTEFGAGLDAIMQLAVPGQQNKRAVGEIAVSAWANVNRDGDYNIIHSHADNHWSGIYYVATGQPDPGYHGNGHLLFYDPRGGATFSQTPGFPFGMSMSVKPVPGLLLVFPSWHLHSVNPFRGRGERISIAFNVRVRNFQIVPREGAHA